MAHLEVQGERFAEDPLDPRRRTIQLANPSPNCYSQVILTCRSSRRAGTPIAQNNVEANMSIAEEKHMEQQKAPKVTGQANTNDAKEGRPKGTKPFTTPGTDPTNPVTQESVGEWVPHEQASERRFSEPGLTDQERQQRGT
jgi:hypothetical protein